MFTLIKNLNIYKLVIIYVLDGRLAVRFFAVEMISVIQGASRTTGARMWFESGQVSRPHLDVFRQPVRHGGRVVCEEPVATDLGRRARRGGQRRHGTAAAVTGAITVTGRIAGLRSQRGQRGQRVGLLVEELQRAARRYRQLVHL